MGEGRVQEGLRKQKRGNRDFEEQESAYLGVVSPMVSMSKGVGPWKERGQRWLESAGGKQGGYWHERKDSRGCDGLRE